MRFNRSQLVQCLAGPGAASAADPEQTVAERLSQWLGWTDAIAIFDALQAGPTVGPSTPRPGASARGQAAIDTYRRTRAELARAITADAVAADDEADTSARPARHRALQRTMESGLAPLRAALRAALTDHSPDLARLATLDALLEQALSARERHLLANVPGLLAQQSVRAGPTRPDAAARQRALLAELELRLQPIDGLAEALSAALTTATPVRHE